MASFTDLSNNNTTTTTTNYDISNSNTITLDFEFSSPFLHNNTCKYSPNSMYLLNNEKYRILIRDMKTLNIIHVFIALNEQISKCEWSYDSNFIYVAYYKKSYISVFDLNNTKWICKIDESIAGLNNIIWSNDSNFIITASDHNLRLSIWSISDRSSSYIRYPKDNCYKLSTNGFYFAVIERKDCKDILSIYSTTSWEICKSFNVDTFDCDDLLWAPNDTYIAIWDNPVDYLILVYSPDGTLLWKYMAYEVGLGIKSVTWSKNSKWLAVGSYDEMIRIFEHRSWRTIAEFKHESIIEGNVAVYLEVDATLSPGHYTTTATPYSVLTIKPEDKPNPKIGISSIMFSSNSSFIASRNDSMPTSVFIWDVKASALLAVLVQLEYVRVMQWHPTKSLLAICASTPNIYIWTPDGAYVVHVPQENLNVVSIRWNEEGSSLLLIDKEQAVICYANL